MDKYNSDENQSVKSNDINTDDVTYTGVITAIVVILVTLLLFILYKRRKSVRQGVLLLGLCDAGKTLIFSRLLHHKFVHTQTSIKENIGEYITDNKNLRIIDIPGHERLRFKFFDQYKSMAKAIIFVIDSVTLPNELRDVAEFMYTLLTDSDLYIDSIMVLCNKQDHMSAKGSTLIKNLLEKELNTLRITKSNQLKSVGTNKEVNILPVKEGKDFDFSVLSVNVVFGESIAFNKDKETPADITQLEKWLGSLL